MIRQILQLLFQVIYLPFLKGKRLILHYLCIFRYITDKTTVSIAHGFQKADGHSLHITGQNKCIGIGKQLFQIPSSHKVRKDDLIISGCHFNEL